MTLIREGLGEGPDFDRIAAECGLSRAHFFALFRRGTNLTPSVYANELRMEEGIRKLSTSQSAIAGISLDLGFSAQSHFTRFFREHLGIAPSEYRKVVDIVEPEAAEPSPH